ncbi:MAG: SAM-dependent methyltransferase [Promicromonosporaceae bacterium]|nr:SAM-dependent methyltransferase [Promicromonosporaceae bacterium]
METNVVVPREASVSPLIKSKQRVKAYGEVFTPPHIVAEMLDLVQEQIERVDATFLEPAAGDGNFLVAILRRKLTHVAKTHPRELWAQESLFALASIYGIELLGDNHADAKANMLETFREFHRETGTTCDRRTKLYRAALFLIDQNIVQGNTLTGLFPDGTPITFSWWKRQITPKGTRVWREPFTFNAIGDNPELDMVAHDSYQPCTIDQVYRIQLVSAGVGALFPELPIGLAA